MILANKIIALRKKAGWSQEDLADQLGVSRQSVSKWEGAQSIPDMDKIVQMSRIFGVSTDYLLKDELCDEDPIVSVSEEGRDVRRVSMEEAFNYLSLRRRMAPRMAIATFLCVLSPVLLMMLAALSEVPDSGVSENLASAIGLCTMFGLVAVSVGLFISCGSKTREFSFLDGVGFETEYGVEGMLRDRMRTFAPTHTRLCIAGTILCIVSVIPIFVASGLEVDDFLMVLSVCFMFILVGIGCVCFVYGKHHREFNEKAFGRRRLLKGIQESKSCDKCSKHSLLACGDGHLSGIFVLACNRCRRQDPFQGKLAGLANCRCSLCSGHDDRFTCQKGRQRMTKVCKNREIGLE